MLWEIFDDPLLLLFVLILVIVASGTVICLVALFARAGNEAMWIDTLNHVGDKWSAQILRLDADYKALVESYLRETGKVWIPPSAPAAPPHLPPASPNPWRMRPPPWSTPSTAPKPAPMQTDFNITGDDE